ncbi:ChaN family lipoprotein [Cognatishimia sp. MH4019]|uniref:ChaN family lipoprotein n=1 Tax=Cognatishimia sp. MH4019 TaxID=2854030 RepID=UPI001CD3B581|nr:ChaN family lipoprotein [Cognatishimia sp. MH4019]
MSSLTNLIGAAFFLAAAPVFALDLPDVDVVILGEVHDNPIHHIKQAEAVAAIAPSAVVFEMLTPEQAGRATPDSRTDLSTLEAAIGWNATGWPDFAMYYPIFEALGDEAIYGAALPRESVRAAMTEGAAAVFSGEPAIFGLSDPLPEAQLQARKQLQDDAHCNAMPAEMLGGMVEAQRLRDAAFAQTTLQALRDTGGPVVVITGHGHARKDWGIPAKIALADPKVDVWSVGFLEATPPSSEQFDFIEITEPAPREDPCAAFR